MTRTYSVKYKSKSKMLTTEEAVENTIKEIEKIELVKSVSIADDGQILTVETDAEENFSSIMDKVVNVFRRIDDKSEVSYDFALNRNN